MRILFTAFIILLSNSSNAEQFKIPWKGDYKHNSSKTWSRDNPYDSGYSKNFLNGAPEEGGKVQKDGELKAEVIMPDNTVDPIPFMIVMHGCTGLENTTDVWAHQVAKALNAEGLGVLILNSFVTRFVHKTCGMPDLHWARRRADDAYSALDYLIEHKLAKPDEVYLMGQSNGGAATLIAMTDKESDHKYRFKAGFPVAPSCGSATLWKYGVYVRPMVLFAGEQDDATPAKYCVEMLKRKQAVPIQLIVYKDANHGFMFNYLYPMIVTGWVDDHGKKHEWHLSSNPTAEKDMMQTIISALKTKKFAKGVESR